MPSGRTASPHIADNKDGTVTVGFSPTERGLHEMDIQYDGRHIPGDPPPTGLNQSEASVSKRRAQ